MIIKNHCGHLARKQAHRETTAAMKFFNILVIGLTFASAMSLDTDWWYLRRVGDVTATPDSTGSGLLTILLKYRVPNTPRRFIVNIFKIDCVTPTTFPSSQVQDISTVWESLRAVSLSFDQETITSSGLWRTGVDPSTGYLDVCVRTSVLLINDASDTVYNFDEQKVRVKINLAEGFEVNDIDVDREAASENDPTAGTEYGLTACQWDPFIDLCILSPVVQGDPVTIRIQTPADSGVQISSVLTLTYSRGQTFLDAITSAGPQKLTEVTPDGPYDFTIQTILPASFYDAGLNNVPFVGSGTVLLRFGNARVRNLRFTIGDSVDHMPGRSASRMMQDQANTTETGFSLLMALAPIESEDAPTADSMTGAIIGGIVGGIAGVAVIIVALVLIARRRRKKEDDYAEGVYKDEGSKDEAYTEDDNKDDGDNEVDYKDEAFTKVNVKEEYAMTGPEVYA